MIKYLQKIRDLASIFNRFEIQQIPRSENSRANLLSKLAMSVPLELHKKIFFEVMGRPSIEEPMIIMQTDEEPFYIDPLVSYLNMGCYPWIRRMLKK